MGLVIVRMIIATTVLTIGLGIVYQPRTWCLVCPMGTMAHYLAKLKSRSTPAIIWKAASEAEGGF